jgi:hypothetical protein
VRNTSKTANQGITAMKEDGRFSKKIGEPAFLKTLIFQEKVMNRNFSPILALCLTLGFVICGYSAQVKTEPVKTDEQTGEQQKADAIIQEYRGAVPDKTVNMVESKVDKEQQDKAIDEIKKLGGRVKIDEKDPDTPVIGVSFDNTPSRPIKLTDADMKNLKAFPRLQKLEFVGALSIGAINVTDAGLENLIGLTQLQSLDLGGTKITDAGLIYLTVLTQLKELSLGNTEITGAGLAKLKGLSKLQKLQLPRSKFTDAGVANLKWMTNLQYLNISGTQITDAALASIKEMPQIQELWFTGTQITDAGLENLKGLTKLQKLYLHNTNITDAGLERLKDMTQLRDLGLISTRITDAGLANLKGMSQLNLLDLRHTQITDAGLENLIGLTQLQNLSLDDTKITDAAVVNLTKLTKLQVLHISSTGVTSAGVAKLKQALPSCTIVASPPTSGGDWGGGSLDVGLRIVDGKYAFPKRHYFQGECHEPNAIFSVVVSALCRR